MLCERRMTLQGFVHHPCQQAIDVLNTDMFKVLKGPIHISEKLIRRHIISKNLKDYLTFGGIVNINWLLPAIVIPLNWGINLLARDRF